jgi:hypothetical protein
VAFDYQPLADLSAELVAEFGRIVTFRELGDVAGTPSQPWLGAANPRSSPKQTLDLSAVIVEPSSLNALGNDAVSDDFIKRSQQIAIVYSAVELAPFDEVLDTDGSIWKIALLSKLKPGGVLLLYFVGLTR